MDIGSASTLSLSIFAQSARSAGSSASESAAAIIPARHTCPQLLLAFAHHPPFLPASSPFLASPSRIPRRSSSESPSYSQSYPIATARDISPVSRKWSGFQSEKAQTAFSSARARSMYLRSPVTRYAIESVDMRYSAMRET